MPRFEKEGFNPEKRINNDNRDRSVPLDENYYGDNYLSDDAFDFDGSVVDNQIMQDINSYIDDFSKIEPPSRNNNHRRQEDYFVAPQQDYDLPRQTPSKSTKQRRSDGDKRKRALKPKDIARIVVAVILAIVILCGCVVGSAFGKITYDDKRANAYVGSSDLQHKAGIKNILLLGVDARNPENDKESRSDSMMLVSIDSIHHCIKMVSFLRDSWVYIPAKDGKQRLNAACQIDGYNGVVDTIEYNFGIDIDGYVVADFEMFKVLVDSIGGVEVEVSEKEAKEVTKHKKRYGNVVLDSGKYKLTGEQALAYCRIRKIDTDFMRAYRQRTVMQSILKGVKGSNPLKLVSMATKCAPYIETNMSRAQIISTCISALPCLKGEMVETRVPFDKTWSYASIGGASVIKIDVDANKEKLIDYIYNKSVAEIKAEQND